ncbi:MAG: hypothetical protein DMF65_06725, partial [Acidobacteria bacterium]
MKIMRNKSRLNFQTHNSAALAACLCLAFAASSSAQNGDLTGGVGQFAVQPKKTRVVAQAKPKPPAIKTGTRASVNDQLLVAANKGDAATTANLLKSGADANAKSNEGCAALVYAAAGK